MKVSFEASFATDLKGIKDKALLKRVEQVIAEVKAATALSEIKSLIKMRGYATFYRIRLGDYLIGTEAEVASPPWPRLAAGTSARSEMLCKLSLAW